MEVCIYGLGAIGGLIAARLAGSGVVVNAIARGATLDVVNHEGLTLIEQVEGKVCRRQFSVHACAHPKELGVQDLVIIAVKTTALQNVARDIAPLLGPHTTVLCAMNGIPWWFFHGLQQEATGFQLASTDPLGVISAAIPAQRVVGCVTHLAAATDGPAVIRHIAGNHLIVGEPTGQVSSARCAQIIYLLRQGGFDVEESVSIQHDIWFKLWGNMTINPIAAMTGATGTQILNDELVVQFMTRCMIEAANLGKRIGLPIESDPASRHEMTRKLGAFKASMLQDVEAGKSVELDSIVGAVIEIARRVHEPTPNIDTLFGLARLHAQVRLLY
jgi:2-dehydropantoate 2-reductase